MFQRRNKGGDLPLAGYSSSTTDGSGHSIKMDAPIVRSMKSSSTTTRMSYVWFLGSLLVLVVGYKHIRYNYATVNIDCKTEGCEFSISPIGRGKKVKQFVERKQLLRADYVKVDEVGNIMENMDRQAPMHRNRKKGKYTNGPDDNGWYYAYAIVLKEYPPVEVSALDDDSFTKDLHGIIGSEREAEIYRRKERKKKQLLEQQMKQVSLSELFSPYIDSKLSNSLAHINKGEVLFVPRLFNANHSNKRPNNAVTKINSYVQEKRYNIKITETTHVKWQGVLGIVFGAFSLLLSLLIGQFWEPESDKYNKKKKKKMGGPGARTSPNLPPRMGQTAARRSGASNTTRTGRVPSSASRMGSVSSLTTRQRMSVPSGADSTSYGQTRHY